MKINFLNFFILLRLRQEIWLYKKTFGKDVEIATFLLRKALRKKTFCWKFHNFVHSVDFELKKRDCSRKHIGKDVTTAPSKPRGVSAENSLLWICHIVPINFALRAVKSPHFGKIISAGLSKLHFLGPWSHLQKNQLAEKKSSAHLFRTSEKKNKLAFSKMFRHSYQYCFFVSTEHSGEKSICCRKYSSAHLFRTSGKKKVLASAKMFRQSYQNVKFRVEVILWVKISLLKKNNFLQLFALLSREKIGVNWNFFDVVVKQGFLCPLKSWQKIFLLKSMHFRSK